MGQVERIKLVYTRILDKGQSKGYIVKIKRIIFKFGAGGARFLSGRVKICLTTLRIRYRINLKKGGLELVVFFNLYYQGNDLEY